MARMTDQTKDTESLKEVDKALATVQRSNQARLEDLKSGIETLNDETKALIAEVDAVLDPEILNNTPVDQLPPVQDDSVSSSEEALSWDDVVETAEADLIQRGIDVPQSIVQLLSDEENKQISDYLNRPIYERIPWDRWDLFVAFGAGIAGAAVDILLGTPGRFVQNAMADKEHWLGEWMESIHEKHPKHAPIDYMGKDFMGKEKFGYHRGLTTGHDLLNPLEGIKQFKDGEFRGFYWQDGMKFTVEETQNQYGTEYSGMSWQGAVLAWGVHNICDFFSSTSLPIPGTSYLYGLPNRDIRIFVQKHLYQKGINLRHVTLQTLTPLVVEVVIRSYMAIRYKNVDAPKDALRQKRTELLALGHTITTAVNIGKIAILKDPTMLNIPALLLCLKNVLGMVVLEQKRNSFAAKITRNVAELRANQDEIESMLESRFVKPVLLS